MMILFKNLIYIILTLSERHARKRTKISKNTFRTISKYGNSMLACRLRINTDGASSQNFKRSICVKDCAGRMVLSGQGDGLLFFADTQQP
jgi:hypothetical protein